MIKRNRANKAVEFNATAASHDGLVQSSNQDRYYVGRLCERTTLQKGLDAANEKFNIQRECGAKSDPGLGSLLIVADGVGGNVCGEVAAEIAVASFVSYVEHRLKSIGGSSMDESFWMCLGNEAIEHCQTRILEHQSRHPECRGMATTFSACILVGKRVYVVHAGDSRVYLARGRKLIQLTIDQTIAQRLIDDGGISPQQAWKSQFAHCLWSALGGKNVSLEPQVFGFDIQSRDRLLLCSDGLSNVLDEHDISRILESRDGVVRQCAALIENSLAKGAQDNVTAVIGEFVSIESNAFDDPALSTSVHNLCQFGFDRRDILYSNE